MNFIFFDSVSITLQPVNYVKANIWATEYRTPYSKASIGRCEKMIYLGRFSAGVNTFKKELKID